MAHRTSGEIWALLGNIDAVHGFYYFIMHAVFGVWDGGLIALRVPSVIATVVAAAGVGAIGARMAGPRAGVLAGTTFAIIPMVQQYAQEGRSYALVSAAVVWASYFFVRAIEDGKQYVWAAYSLLIVAAGWLHEFAALVLVAHGVTLLLVTAPLRVRLTWLFSATVSVIMLLPLAVISVGQSGQQLGWLGRPGLSVWFQSLAISAAGMLMGYFITHNKPASITASLSTRLPLSSLALPLLVVPSGLLLAISIVKPWYVDRYVLYSVTGLALLAGVALDLALRLWKLLGLGTRRMIGCFAVLGLLAILLPWSLAIRSPDSRKDDAVAVAAVVAAQALPGDAVVFMPARRREWLLSAPATYHKTNDLLLKSSPAASRTLQGVEVEPEIIRSRILEEGRIIALTDPPGQPRDTTVEEAVKREVLREHFKPCLRFNVRGAQITVYAKLKNCP
ncbi:glycosyltransferase family 39 protein [Streptomyces cinereospinus]|uniref:Glycosyltransferase family 39 protein n=1 Tax=Streptomyces cinereospinus TaxID=285561 RepID=A0ABV5N4E0_9ACTN